MNQQHFTEEEAKALKGKSVMAKTDQLSVEIGTFGAVTMVDKYGIDWDDAGKALLVWQVIVRWDTDDADEVPVYDEFTRKDAFNKHIEIVDKAKRKRGYNFSEAEAHALIGTRVRAKTSANLGLLKQGEAGTVTGVRKEPYSDGRVRWDVEITWDATDKGYMRAFSLPLFRKYLEILKEQLQEVR